MSDNHEITDKALISDAFNEHFSSVAERLAVSIDQCESNPKELGIQSPLYRFKLGIFRRTKSSMPLINLKIVSLRECIICLIEFEIIKGCNRKLSE